MRVSRREERSATGSPRWTAFREEVLDESFTTALSGPSRDYAESSSNIVFAFLLALVLIYLVLAAQFESFRDPFTIMLTVPLALAGALALALALREDAEHLQRNRDHHADRARDEERDPDRRICEPAKRERE